MNHARRNLLKGSAKVALSASKDISVNIAKTTLTALTELSSLTTSALAKSLRKVEAVKHRRDLRRGTPKSIQRQTTKHGNLDPDWYYLP